MKAPRSISGARERIGFSIPAPNAISNESCAAIFARAALVVSTVSCLLTAMRLISEVRVRSCTSSAALLDRLCRPLGGPAQTHHESAERSVPPNRVAATNSSSGPGLLAFFSRPGFSRQDRRLSALVFSLSAGAVRGLLRSDSGGRPSGRCSYNIRPRIDLLIKATSSGTPAAGLSRRRAPAAIIATRASPP